MVQRPKCAQVARRGVQVRGELGECGICGGFEERVRTTATRTSATFAWQGWRLELPPRWNPVKLEGDYHDGYALIADMDRPQLGVRWRTISGKHFDSDRWARRALRDEVGKLAAAKGKPFSLDEQGGAQSGAQSWAGSLLFVEPDPPGRDVWVAHSRVSGRVIEIVHHVRRREGLLRDAILPGVVDSQLDRPRPWAVFDLACSVGPGYELKSHQLNAGDLSLQFARKRQMLTVRQIALAEMALRRMSLDKWLASQERAVRTRYAAKESPEPWAVRDLQGVRRTSLRRRRFALMRWLAPGVITAVLHDRVRDRLILLQSSDETALLETARSVGG